MHICAVRRGKVEPALGANTFYRPPVVRVPVQLYPPPGPQRSGSASLFVRLCVQQNAQRLTE